jgi:16S rRNA (uracil1498-N3)-methyltransferase
VLANGHTLPIVTPRFFVDLPLTEGHVLDLSEDAVRHIQVRRLQAGMPIILFNGRNGEWLATIGHVGRTTVQVRVGSHQAVDRELASHITIAIAMPANERMDLLVEKLTELGVAAIQPLVSERSVLRPAGERAVRKREHWQAIAASACEQCGRTRLPRIEPIRALDAWLGGLLDGTLESRWLLSLRGADPLSAHLGAQPPRALVALSGPEGGFTAAEEIAALDRGFVAISLGTRILRADTAPLALAAAVALA